MRRRRNHPEWRGDGTAKALELKRAKRAREQQLKRAQKQQNGLEEKATMQATTPESGPPMKRRRVLRRGKPLDPRIRAVLLEERDKGVGFEALVLNLERVIRGLGADPEGHSCRHQLGLALDDPSHEFMAYWLGYFGQLAGGVRGNVQYREPPRTLEPIVVDAPSAPVQTQASSNDAPNTIEFNGRAVRILLIRGEPWFMAKDLVDAVGATWSGHSLDHIPAEYRGMVSVSTPSGAQQMVCLNEAGMNFYLIRSDKPAALPLQKKIASEVLVQIRKTGRYEAPGAAPQLPPPALDYQAMGAAMGAAIAPAITGAVITVIRELLPGRSPRRRKTATNPDQQTIPEANLRLVPDLSPVPRRDTSHLLMGHPRLQRMPRPADVKDPKLFQTLRNAIDAYGQITSNFDEPYLLVYDEINRTFDPELTKRKHGERIQYIGSQPAKYQRQAYEAAYRVLVAPYLKAAS